MAVICIQLLSPIFILLILATPGLKIELAYLANEIKMIVNETATLSMLFFKKKIEHTIYIFHMGHNCNANCLEFTTWIKNNIINKVGIGKNSKHP